MKTILFSILTIISNYSVFSQTKTNVVITETVIVPKYRLNDIVEYQSKGKWIKTSIMNLGPDLTYQLFTDTNQMETIWKKENEIRLFSLDNYSNKIEFKDEINGYTFNQLLEYYDDNTWKQGNLIDINSEGNYKFKQSSNWYTKDDVRKISDITASNFKEGDKVLVLEKEQWIESQIIQINPNGTYQVFINSEQTLTKWVDKTKIKTIK